VAIFLGIDAGGSKTTCAVGDETSLLATATAGGSNIIRLGEEQARAALHHAVREACATARVDPTSLTRVCAGLAGAARPQISEAARRILAEIVSCEIDVVGDMVIALNAAFSEGNGVIVIAGTGSIAYGKNPEGQTARVGGWGFAISDEGSGHWIGRTAVSSTLRAQDEGERSVLFQLITAAWRLETLDDLVQRANSTPPPDFSALMAPVLAASDGGDVLARSILTQAGAELARLGKIVIARIFAGQAKIPVAMSGGVFRSSPLVRQVFYNSLRSEYPNAAVTPTVVDPVKGALALARKSA
jgi:N-acetylglucosamine kinase-like BadF-type ATPase